MLRLFNVDDGETHKIVAESAEMARRWAIEHHGIDAKEIESIDMIADDYQLVVYMPYGPDGQLPSAPVQDERGRWYCSAPVSEWLALAYDGDMICSSVY